MTAQAKNTVSNALPCPFCGGEAISGTTLDDFGYVMCRSEACWGMAGYLPTEAEAIAAWNRRATADVTEAMVERATKAMFGDKWPVGFSPNVAIAAKFDMRRALIAALKQQAPE